MNLKRLRNYCFLAFVGAPLAVGVQPVSADYWAEYDSMDDCAAGYQDCGCECANYEYNSWTCGTSNEEPGRYVGACICFGDHTGS